jgi:nicotinamidase-related amidase
MNARSPDDPRAPLGRGERTAVLVIDMLTDYDHPDGDALQESARDVVPVIAGLLERAREEDVPVIWINDNHGAWSEDREALIAAVRRDGDAALIDPVVPDEDAPFVFKARHSIFFGSPLEYLLELEGIGRLVMTGQVTEQCVLYSALDAYIRHFQVVIPRDAVAHIDPDLADASLRLMERNMRAQVVDAADVELQPELAEAKD